MNIKIKKGDKVQIVCGKDRLKKTKKGEKTYKANQGKVLQVLPEAEKIVVEGLNIRIKHVKPKKMGEKGQKIELPAAMDISNVMLVCSKCNKTTRVGFSVNKNEEGKSKKVRICKKCKETID
ncbi:MAG TPA: 50S ribosomal protein L24 [Candidatus Bipolaricaulota bacterium]|nr:50S ribosomal protein L24 [Candidatus Bipolaricaulota bacterium]